MGVRSAPVSKPVRHLRSRPFDDVFLPKEGFSIQEHLLRRNVKQFRWTTQVSLGPESGVSRDHIFTTHGPCVNDVRQVDI